MKSLRLLREGRFSEEEIQAEFRDLKSTLDVTVDKGRLDEIWKGCG